MFPWLAILGLCHVPLTINSSMHTILLCVYQNILIFNKRTNSGRWNDGQRVVKWFSTYSRKKIDFHRPDPRLDIPKVWRALTSWSLLFTSQMRFALMNFLNTYRLSAASDCIYSKSCVDSDYPMVIINTVFQSLLLPRLAYISPIQPRMAS